MEKKAKIIATLGPSIYSESKLYKLVHLGVDAFRINFSHDTSGIKKIISKIRKIEKKKDKKISLIADLQGIKLRIGKIKGGNAYNILAEKVKLIGTVRCTNTTIFKSLGNWLQDNISSIASSCGAESFTKFREITPPVHNDSLLNKILRASSIEILGQDNVIELQKPSLGAEDFAEFLNEVPGAMFRLGVSGNKGCAPLHSSKFDPDERAIIVGIKVIVESIVKLQNILSK